MNNYVLDALVGTHVSKDAKEIFCSLKEEFRCIEELYVETLGALVCTEEKMREK